jgi:tellurite resistance protein
MIIWGSKGRTSTQATGDFYCSECSDYRPYGHKVVKKWFTLYFIPVFPMSTLGEYIECNSCNSTFKMNALDYDPKAQQEQIQAIFALATRDIMIKIAMADGSIDPDEISTIERVYENVTKHSLTGNEITQRVEELTNDPQNIEVYASTMSGFLNDTGKEMVLRAAVAISKADGVVDSSEIEILHRLADSLDLPKAYANGIFSEEGIDLKK